MVDYRSVPPSTSYISTYKKRPRQRKGESEVSKTRKQNAVENTPVGVAGKEEQAEDKEADEQSKTKKRKKKKRTETADNSEAGNAEAEDKEADEDEQSKTKKRKKGKTTETEAGNVDDAEAEVGDGRDEEAEQGAKDADAEKIDKKRKKKKRAKDDNAQVWLEKEEEWKIFLAKQSDDTKISETIRELKLIQEQHEFIKTPFTNLSEEEAKDQLADPLKTTELCFPSHDKFGGDKFTYVGRSLFKDVLDKMEKALSGTIYLEGPPGRGKSCILKALASYLQVYTRYKLLYIKAASFAVLGFEYLRNALLLTFAVSVDKQQKVLSCKDMSSLIRLCRVENKNLIIIVDEANALDSDTMTASTSQKQREKARNALAQIEARLTIMCAYVKPKERRRTLTLVRPYNPEELQTLLDSVGQTEADLQDLFFYTAYIPRHVSAYFEDKDNHIEDMTGKYRNLCERLRTDNNVVSLLEDTFNGYSSAAESLQPEIFYQSGRFTAVLPFLETRLRIATLKERQKVVLGSLEDKLEYLKELFSDDEARSWPGLLGGMAEWATRNHILALKRLGDVVFQKKYFYKVNQERLAVQVFGTTELESGVCMIPLESTCKDIDFTVVKKVSNKDELEVFGVQVTISCWETKQKKHSHEKWLKEAEKLWTCPKLRIVPRFICILTDTTRATSSLASFTSQVICKQFKDVHDSLAFIDRVNLPDPEVLLRCTYMLSNATRCKNMQYSSPSNYERFLCRHHNKEN